jgi:alkylation response protein AidB-like acyl-CoA dehydrogenase
MRFSFTEEQEELRRVVRRFLEEKSPVGEVRRLMDTAEGYEPAVWKQLSQELALPGVAIPEAYGGQGAGFVELGIALEEMGRALLCAPYFGSIALGANAVLNAGPEAQRRRSCRGSRAADARGARGRRAERRWDAGGIALEARQSKIGWTLHGEKSFVVDGMNADLVIVAARARLTLFTCARARARQPARAGDDRSHAQARAHPVRRRARRAAR